RNGASSAPPAARAGAMIGLPTVRLQRHSIMKERPEPFGPPKGSKVVTVLGSVVSRPWASIPHPGGMSRPASRALMIFPIATFEVDMSRTSGGLLLAGKAIASGLLDTPDTLAPWEAIIGPGGDNTIPAIPAFAACNAK